MSFRITQCPACDSTFSLSPRVLETAAGKVRCGACLTVFEAAEHFLSNDFDAEAGNESVFVGNSAQEFFDPSSFFTRQSLQESLPDRQLETQQDTRQEIPLENAEAPDRSALDSTDSVFRTSDPGQAVEPDAPDEDEFQALVAAAQTAPEPAAITPVAEPLAAGGYPALEEVINDELEEAITATTEAAGAEATGELSAVPAEDSAGPRMQKTIVAPAAELLAAGGYPAIEEVIVELLADSSEDLLTTSESTGSESEPSVQLTPVSPELETTTAGEAEIATGDSPDAIDQPLEPASLPLFPEEEEPAAAALHDETENQSTSDQPAAAPEAFALHVQFSVEPTVESPASVADIETSLTPDSSTGLAGKLDSSEDEFNTELDEAEFQHALTRDMDSAPSEHPDVELPPDDEPAESLPDATADSTPPQTEEPEQTVAAIRARALQSDLQDEDGLEAIPEENLQSLGAFSTPVEILTGRQRRLGRQLAWASLSLVAALALTAQYLWQEMARYSQVASVRPVYEWTCELAGCDLPVYNDIDAIQSSNLAVRSHPELENALVVNVEFRNAASFAQQFPIMVLSFNSASNSIIALREFAPEDYLPSALRSRSLLPPYTPVQLNLELMDPGEDAVNYTLAFRRP